MDKNKKYYLDEIRKIKSELFWSILISLLVLIVTENWAIPFSIMVIQLMDFRLRYNSVKRYKPK